MISIFILPSNHFRNWDVQRKGLIDAQREKEREKERLTDAQREKDHVVDRDLAKHRADRDLAKHRVDRDLAKHRVDRDLAFASIAILRSTAPIAIAISQSVDRDLVKHRADRSPSLNPIASLSPFFSQFDRIWWFFFSGFCLCFCIEEWMILYICLATEKMWENVIGFDDFFFGFCLCFCIEEWMIFYIRLAIEKMWATSRKCVFYGIFKNTTKHQKIFFEIFFEMQPNTWKHFPFRKIAFLENGIFSGNAFIQTKRSLNYKFL